MITPCFAEVKIDRLSSYTPSVQNSEGGFALLTTTNARFSASAADRESRTLVIVLFVPALAIMLKVKPVSVAEELIVANNKIAATMPCIRWALK